MSFYRDLRNTPDELEDLGITDGTNGQFLTTDGAGNFTFSDLPAGAAETITSLSLNANILTYTDEDGVDTDIDLSLYLDDTNLARITSGTLDSGTGIATFTRDDATTFTVDFSNLMPAEATSSTFGVLKGQIVETASLTSLGTAALANNSQDGITGLNNTAVGQAALFTNTDSNNLTAVGRSALRNSTGAENTAIGTQSGQGITTGARNTSIGYASMAMFTGQGAGTTITDNTAVGRQSLTSITGFDPVDGVTPLSTIWNIAVGNNSLTNLVAGANNTAIGGQTGEFLTGGSENVFIGKFAGSNTDLGDNVTSATNVTIIGNDARVSTNAASNEVTIGGPTQNRLRFPGVGLDTANASAGQTLEWNGSSFSWVTPFDETFASLSGKPTTLSGYGITDAFDGTYGSLTGTPVLSTVATSGNYTDLSNTPTIPSTLTDLGIIDGSNNQVLTTDGSGNFTFTSIAGFDGEWSSLSNTPTTLSGYGITDAFDGQYSSLTGTPTLSTVATTGAYSDLSGLPSIPSALTDLSITDGTNGQVLTTNGAGTFTFTTVSTFDGAFSSLTGTPTSLAGYGITDAFDGAFSSLTGTPTTLSGYGITDSFDGDYNSLSNLPTLPTSAGAYTEGLVYGKALAGTSSQAIGNSALASQTGGANNTAIGVATAFTQTTASNVTAVGRDALRNADASDNTAIGAQAGRGLTTGSNNTAIGRNAMAMYSGQGVGTTITDNTAIGRNSLSAIDGFDPADGVTPVNTTWNITVGNNSFSNVKSGGGNTGIGGQTGSNMSISNYNTFIGMQAGTHITSGGSFITGDNNVVIGYDARLSADGVSNQIVLGNLNNDSLTVPGLGLAVTSSETALPGALQLEVLTSEPVTPSNGMIAICDGTIWDAAGTGTQACVVYLAGSWQVLADA
jgi:hypothetical protein